MEYRKRVLVIKQILQGFSLGKTQVNAIARLETEGEVADFYFSVINLCSFSGGEYIVCLTDGNGRLLEYPLGKRPCSLIKQISPCNAFESGFSAGIVFVKDNIPQVVAFNKTENFEYDLTYLKKKIAESCLNKLKQEKEQVVYNDEALATEDYFEKEKNKQEILTDEQLFEKKSNEKVYDSKLDSKLCENYALNKEKFNNDNSQELTPHDSAVPCLDISENDKPYYLTVKKQLEDIFFKFPQETELCEMFPKSRWAKIHYSKDKYYVVGLMFESGKEKYICYGVPETFSETPPVQLTGYCSFVPLSIFDMKGKGYWMMFQDAKTGKCIKNSPISLTV